MKPEKDGTLPVDKPRLSQALSKYPDVVEKMFRASDDNVIGLSAQMNTIQMSSTSSIYGLTASYNNLTQQKSDTALAQTKLADSRQTASDALTARFAQMNSRVTAYKSVQSFMDQQVKMWTKGN